MREEWQKESPYNNLTEGKVGERKREGGNERSEQRETERERSAFSLPPPLPSVCVCVYACVSVELEKAKKDCVHHPM